VSADDLIPLSARAASGSQGVGGPCQKKRVGWICYRFGFGDGDGTHEHGRGPHGKPDPPGHRRALRRAGDAQRTFSSTRCSAPASASAGCMRAMSKWRAAWRWSAASPRLSSSCRDPASSVPFPPCSPPRRRHVRAGRPLIVVGGGAMEARPEVQVIADRLEAPVVSFRREYAGPIPGPGILSAQANPNVTQV